MRVIYDLGANNGDDIPYYLLKADRVVAVEANPVLANEIRGRFAREIDTGQLIVEACAITVDSAADSVPFYVNTANHVQSQFVRPSSMNWFEEIQVPSKNIVELIRRHGDPYYIKIDIEHYDQYILRCLFENNIRPQYISSEAHTVDIFCILVDSGRYNRFKLVLGGNVPRDYSNKEIVALDGVKHFISWPHHSAGPFGEDVNGSWRTAQEFFNDLKPITFGWIDIHATQHNN